MQLLYLNLQFPSALVILYIILAPFIVLVTVVICLASVGASFGLRKMYVKALLKLFEVCI